MKIKIILSFGLLFVFYTRLTGQQLGQYSQYLQNPYILNPAAAGMMDQTDVNLSLRNQWTGMSNAPITYYLSGNTVFQQGHTPYFNLPILRTSEPKFETTPNTVSTGNIKHAVGGLISIDKYGAFRKINGMASYAIHLPIRTDYMISLGLGIGVSNLQFDNSLINLENPNDQTYTNFISQKTSTTFFDLNAGLWFYGKGFYFGYSSNQLLQNKIFFGDSPTSSRVLMHHFITAGYSYELNEKIDLIPSFIVKYMTPAPVSFDITLKTEYEKKYWLGISYRNQDALVAMLGLTLNNMFKLGYSYDFTTSNLSNYSNGSHEVILGIIFK